MAILWTRGIAKSVTGGGARPARGAIDMNRPNLLPVGGLPIIAIRTERLVHRDGAELNGLSFRTKIGDVGREQPPRPVGTKHSRRRQPRADDLRRMRLHPLR